VNNKTIVFFDLDGTITPRDTYKDMLLYGLIKRPWRALLVFLSVYDLLLYKLGKNTNTFVKENLLRRIFIGISLKDAQSMAVSYAGVLLRYGVKKQAIKTLDDHKKKGDRIVLVSASFDFYVNEIATRLGINEVIATKAQIEKGCLTGSLDGENCYGEQKIVRIKQLVNLDDFTNIITYTDHHSDLPLINIATTAYAVCPNQRLKEHMDNLDLEKNVLVWS